MDYEKWLDLYARRCNQCCGHRFIESCGTRVQCLCQSNARKKWHLEQIEITPPELKYLGWKDFTGEIGRGDKIEGHLTYESVVASRDTAFEYCFGETYSPEVLESRQQYISIHKHLKDGQNVIIAGGEGSGKTLLGILILKEVANASQVIKKDLVYKWVHFYKILDAASWSTGDKNINHADLDNMAEMDFLFVDNLDTYRGGHNSPPDHTAMNRVFGTRRIMNLPTIFMCPLRFVKMIKRPADCERIADVFGEEIVRVLSDKRNAIIELIKE